MSDLKQALDAVMQDEIDAKGAVGTLLRVYKNGEEVYRGCFGMDSLEKQTPMHEDAIFRLYSMTKPVTSVAVHKLIEEGRLTKTDAVEKYLSGFANQKVWTEQGLVPVERAMTVGDLLNMTSGLEYPNPCNPVAVMLSEYYGQLENLEIAMPRDTVSICNRLGQFPLLHQPGARWNYSTSADILGGIVEVVTGQKYRDYVRENILLPLGMEDTDFHVPADKAERFASMYIPMEDGTLLEMEPGFLGMTNRLRVQEFQSGGAGLVGTIDDYSRFARMLVNDGTLPACASKSGEEVTILKPETVQSMRVAELTPEQRAYANWDSMKGFSYGNLMRVLVEPENCGYAPAFVGEFGWDGWAGTYVMMDPTNQMVFVYMVQQANGNRPWQYNAIKQAIYEHLV